MEQIKKMAREFAALCEKENVPLLCAFGTDKIYIEEYAPDTTPERILKARTTLITTVKQARRTLEIEA